MVVPQIVDKTALTEVRVSCEFDTCSTDERVEDCSEAFLISFIRVEVRLFCGRLVGVTVKRVFHFSDMRR